MSGSLLHAPSAPATTSAPPAELDSDHAETPLRLGSGLQEELSVLIAGCEGEAELPSVDAALLSAFRRKEKDLAVAARLGKALLERNRELSEQSDRMYRELSDKLEQTEQERHELRWRLESREGEWESRVAELEMDVGQLQREVEIHQARLRELEREKNRAVAELSEQNRKLLEQLSRATEAERLLSAQVQSLREDFEKKSISTDEHMTRLENLQAEIRILSERKRELERRMSAVLAENDVLQAAVDAIQERSLVLEMQCREKDLQCLRPSMSIRLHPSPPVSIHLHPSPSISIHVHPPPSPSISTNLHVSIRLHPSPSIFTHLHLSPSVSTHLQLWEVQCQVHLLCCELRGTDTTDPALPPEMPSTQDVSVERLRGNLMELRGLVQNLLDHSETMVALLSMELRSARREERESPRAAAGLQEEPAERLLSAVRERERDDAVAKKNAMEMELAKCKIDMMSLNSQLLDAIQQKLHLSQQLEAWQDDMVRVIDQQLMDKHQEETSRRSVLLLREERDAAGPSPCRRRQEALLFLQEKLRCRERPSGTDGNGTGRGREGERRAQQDNADLPSGCSP
uniref:BICD family like cargo adaptor 1 n=1 Tax=Scleropages formosus TaxID=113540 RepID=A0A8C9S1Y5_SCLFO